MPTRLPDPYTDDVPGFISAPLVDNDPILQNALPNGRVLQVSSASQFWGLNITFPELYDLEYRIISTAIHKAKNTDGILQVALPQYLGGRVREESLATTTIAAGQAGTSLIIEGLVADAGVPYVGDMFQLSSHGKVYKIVDVDYVAATTTLTLTLYPSLSITTTGLERPKFNDILFNMVLVDRAAITEDLSVDGQYVDYSIRMRESI